jgi:hypothetical protein
MTNEGVQAEEQHAMEEQQAMAATDAPDATLDMQAKSETEIEAVDKQAQTLALDSNM